MSKNDFVAVTQHFTEIIDSKEHKQQDIFTTLIHLHVNYTKERQRLTLM